MPVTKAKTSILRKNSTGSDFERRRVNLIEGSNVTLTVSDDSANNEVDITIASSGSGAAWGTITGTLSDQTDLQTALDAKQATLTGLTSTVAELNILDGVTSTAAELNALDGITSTVTELNYTDGVTSAIQTQLDGKQPLDSDLTTIAGLTATTGNFIISEASAWASRTPTQALTTLGLDADLPTFSVPASTTISAYGATLVDDADASTARTTLGVVAGGAGDIWVEKAGDTMTGNLTVGIADTANAVGVTVTQSDVTNNPRGVSITNTGTNNALFIDQNGDAGTGSENSTDGALLIDNTGNNSLGLQVYSNNGATTNSPLVLIRSDNTAFDDGCLRIIQDGTGGGAYNIRLDGPAPQIEWVESDQATPAGKFETGVNGDVFYIAGRNSGDSSFENVLTLQRVASGGDLTLLGASSATQILLGGDGATVFNEAGNDADFRVEGDTDANLIFGDASTDRVGIGTNTPAALLDVDGTARMITLNIGGTDVTSTAAELNVLDGITATVTELNYTDGVTSAIQTQLDAMVEKAGDTITGVLTLAENAAIALDPAGSADGKFTGITIAGTAGATLAFGDLIYLDPTDSRWELADANAASGADGDARGILGICVLAAASDGSATTILLNGVVRADTAFPALTINAPVYVSETAGDIVVTKPTTTDVVIRSLGFALTADEIYFNPSSDYITYI